MPCLKCSAAFSQNHLLPNTVRKCAKFVIVRRIQVFCDVVLCLGEWFSTGASIFRVKLFKKTS